MPNIPIRSPAPKWPLNLDDLRAEPARLVTTADLARLRIATSYGGLKRLPPPLRTPSGMLLWEARTILLAIGASLAIPTDPANATA